MSEKRGATAFAENSIACSTDAITRFGALYGRLELGNAKAALVGQPTFGVRMEGVNISARPLVLLERRGRDEVQLGAILVVFRKDKTLTKHVGQSVAQLLRSALAASPLSLRGVIRPELCVVVDVFDGGIYGAPLRNTRALDEIQSACREIATRWPFIAGARAA
jgi:hypothetical protein